MENFDLEPDQNWLLKFLNAKLNFILRIKLATKNMKFEELGCSAYCTFFVLISMIRWRTSFHQYQSFGRKIKLNIHRGGRAILNLWSRVVILLLMNVGSSTAIFSKTSYTVQSSHYLANNVQLHWNKGIQNFRTSIQIQLRFSPKSISNISVSSA